MEQFLKYFYNLYIDKIFKQKDDYYFYKEDSLFYVTKNRRTKEEISDIYQIILEMLNHNIPVSQIIPNIYGELISVYEEESYILLKVNCDTTSDITIHDIVKINNHLFLNKDKKELYRNNWASLWESKVDYFEYQIKELGRSKEIILNSFSYYIGLAENAISVANNTALNHKQEYEKIVLSHKRIKYPNMSYDFYNPLHFIFDIEIRDIAEYLKSMFFYTDGQKALEKLKNYLQISKINNYEANMLFARLLYPSYYFDIYEKVIEDMEEESLLLTIINKVEEYELFLKQVYFELKKYFAIEQVLWIINKKES